MHPDTEFKKFSLFCPNCKTETLINVSKSVISEIFLGHGGFNGVSLCPFVFTPIHPINSTQKAHIHRQAITAIWAEWGNAQTILRQKCRYCQAVQTADFAYFWNAMNVEGKRYVGGDFPVHLLTMGKLFNKRLVPCAFGIKIGLYFHIKTPLKSEPTSSDSMVFLL